MMQGCSIILQRIRAAPEMYDINDNCAEDTYPNRLEVLF